MSDLKKIIDGIVEDKTFSLEAIEAIKKLRDTKEILEKELEETKDKLALSEIEVSKLEAETLRLDKMVDRIAVREAEILEKEKSVHSAQISQSADKATAEALKYAMETVFKPQQFRRDLLRDSTYSSNSNRNDGSFEIGTAPVVTEITTEE